MLNVSKKEKKKFSALSVNQLRNLCVQENIIFNNKPMTFKGPYIKKKTLIELLLSKNSKLDDNYEKIPNSKVINTNNCYSIAVKGDRDYMEDTFTINTFEDITIYAVFDGHGGDEISKKLVTLYPKAVFQNLNREDRYNVQKVKKIINALYCKIDYLLKKTKGDSGSTAIVCITIGNTLYMINLGDSRGSIFYYKNNQPTLLFSTSDHKPDNIMEKLWINKCGGTVEQEEDDDPRVDGDLALSRAFGDYYLKYKTIDDKIGPVSNIPDIKAFAIDFSKKMYIILASDGLWDVMDNQEAINYVDPNNLEKSCSFIINESLKKSTDNITVLLAKI